MGTFKSFPILGFILSCFLAVTASAQRITFHTIPTDWTVKNKPFTKASVFEIQDDPANPEHRWLSASSAKASASLLSDFPLAVDLKKTPIVRWRWRATVLPHGADGRNPDKDDQVIGLYISSGTRLKQQSIAYRWETQTPIGSEGTVQYANLFAVKWFTVRNECHADGETFFIEERNVAADFKKAFGEIPEKIGIGISCNSQYTDSHSEAQLDWIEFCPLSTQPNPSEHSK
ncbi:MAG: DUF3047 domain-containing protein [Verrucomicrobia bacterium]|nr:DUF3047 domain-containing protein [Verrucomicrobiota bacterium]